MKNRLPQTALTLLVAWIMLVLLSWILTALNPTADLRSLLSAEGIRWLFGRFVYTLSSPLLIWLVLGVMAYGPLTESQLFRLRRPLGVKERFALRVVMLELTIVVVIMALLTLLPQPLLLTATGTVNHSSFLHCLVPVTCVTLIIAGLTFGVGAGKIDGLAGAYNSLEAGFRSGGHLFVFYVLIVLLCSTIGYVFDL